MMMWALAFLQRVPNAQDWVGAVLNWSKTSCSVAGVDAFEGGLMIGWWSKPTNQLHLWHNNRSTQQWAGDNLIQEIWNQDISLGSKLRPILTKECPLKTALHICGYLQFFLGSQRPSNLSKAMMQRWWEAVTLPTTCMVWRRHDQVWKGWLAR